MGRDSSLKGLGWKYLLLALGALTGLGLEFLIIGLSYLAFGVTPSFQGPHWQMILHWIVTCIIWGVSAALLIRLAKAKMGFNVFTKGEKMKLWQWGSVILAVALSLMMSYVAWDMNFKVIREFNANGPLRFAFQYIYYMVETAMFLLIIIFGQKAFESWTAKTNFPWGGIVCGLTWGIAHILSRGFFDPVNGILSTIAGFMFGTVYLLVNRDNKKAWIVLFLMFVL